MDQGAAGIASTGNRIVDRSVCKVLCEYQGQSDIRLLLEHNDLVLSRDRESSSPGGFMFFENLGRATLFIVRKI